MALASAADMARIFQIALDSASEVAYHLLLPADLGYIQSGTHAELSGQVVEAKKLLTASLRPMRASPTTDP